MGVIDEFEEWAVVAAKLRGRSAEARAAILDGAGATADWAQADHKWRRTLVDELGRGNMERAFRFSAICVEDEAARGPDEPIDGDEPEPSMPPAAAVPVPEVVSPASAPSSVPADSVPAPSGGDFRHQAMHAQRPKSERERPTPSGEFREGLMPTDSGPVAPRPGQLRTDHISPDAVKADLKAIRDALAWPLERYTQFALEFERGTAMALVCQRYGIASPAAVHMVGERWRERLAADPGLAARFQQLAAQYRASGS